MKYSRKSWRTPTDFDQINAKDAFLLEENGLRWFKYRIIIFLSVVIYQIVNWIFLDRKKNETCVSLVFFLFFNWLEVMIKYIIDIIILY